MIRWGWVGRGKFGQIRFVVVGNPVVVGFPVVVGDRFVVGFPAVVVAHFVVVVAHFVVVGNPAVAVEVVEMGANCSIPVLDAKVVVAQRAEAKDCTFLDCQNNSNFLDCYNWEGWDDMGSGSNYTAMFLETLVHKHRPCMDSVFQAYLS
jgi:hypothetical protein